MSDERTKRVSALVGYTRKPDGSIEFHGDVPEELRQQVLEDHERAMDYEGKRRSLWGTIGPESMTRLAKMFLSLRDAAGVDPWKPLELLEWLCGPVPGSGATWAALFVLGVWNDLDWNEAARDNLPERECDNCAGIGRLDREEGATVQRGPRPDTYTRRRYDDDGNVIGHVEVPTEACGVCKGKGRYVPAPGPDRARFNVFLALGTWDHEHRAAFETWVKYPFWP